MEEDTIALTKILLKEMQQEATFSERMRAHEICFLLSHQRWRQFVIAFTDQAFRANATRTNDQIRFLLKKYALPWVLGYFPTFLKKKIKKEIGAVLLYENSPLPKGVKINLNQLGEAILSEVEAQKRLDLNLASLDLVDGISVKVTTLFSQISLVGFEESLTALKEPFRLLLRQAGKKKFVFLDMEEYKDFDLTLRLYKDVLSEEEFLASTHGIALQSYLPDSFEALQDLLLWSTTRKAPISIRIVKGANLAMEKVESSMRNWHQAPFLTKEETDAHFLKMLHLAIDPQFKNHVRVGIGSHNLFDIAYAMLLSPTKEIRFEMLHGMAPAMERVVRKRGYETLLYCPKTVEKEFQYACAYLMRRFDENTGPDNFLRHLHDIRSDNAVFESQAEHFRKSFRHISSTRRRGPNKTTFNEPDTDFSLKENRAWIKEIFQMPTHMTPVPFMDASQIEEGISTCVPWALSQEKRSLILKEVATLFRKERGNLIHALMVEGKKIATESDLEVSEAIDFLEYYRTTPFELTPKGNILIAPPWNFPCSIPTGGIAAALIAGNGVLFKPAPETRCVGLKLVELFWKGGVPKEVLKFLPCQDEPHGSALIQDRRIETVVLTGATATAKKLKGLRPNLDLVAETGGKNAMILTALCDRDQAITDLLKSAFGHAGQKCSACSLAIVEKDLYDDPTFLEQLKQAASSLIVGSPFDPLVTVPTVLHEMEGPLRQAIENLEPGESWLVKPSHSSPGIKMGVQEGSFSHQTELFGPVLSLMRAENLSHAIHLANGTMYGLTAGLHSLDEREHAYWKEHIIAGNLYINRTMTGAIVGRQPFGGTKASCYGPGAKAGGPNYVLQFGKANIPEPLEMAPLPQSLISLIQTQRLKEEELIIWKKSAASYAYWAKELKKPVDASHILGQDNFFYHVPLSKIFFRIEEGDDSLSILQILAACQCAETPLEISSFREESQETFLKRVGFFDRIRALRPLPTDSHVVSSPPSSHGRFELLHYLREVTLSVNTHRYGHLTD